MYLKISENKSLFLIVFGKTLYVGGSGPSNYTQIQDAVDSASNGDTAFVQPNIFSNIRNIWNKLGDIVSYLLVKNIRIFK